MHNKRIVLGMVGVIMTVLLLIAQTADSQVPSIPQAPHGSHYIWDGEVCIMRFANARKDEDNSIGSRKQTETKTRTMVDLITISACGTFAGMYVKKVDRTFSDDIRVEKFLEHAQKKCANDVKKPGDSETYTHNTTIRLYEGNDVKPLRELTSVTLMVYPQNQYMITVTANAYWDTRDEEVRKVTDVCTGKVKQYETTTSTVSFNEVPSTIPTPGEDGGLITTIEAHPTCVPFGFAHKAPFEKNALSGEKVLVDKKAKKPGDSDEYAVASWNFHAKDPCPDVYNQLLEDLAWAEAYGDKVLQDLAQEKNMDKDQYELLVAKKTCKIRYGYTPEGDPSHDQASADMETGEVSGLDKVKEDLKKQCKPDIIYKSIAAHESHHTEDQRGFSEQFPGAIDKKNPHVWGLREVNAHVVGIKMLINWMKQYCGDDSLLQEEQRLRNIVANKLQ
jgi:hypothetical protein